MLPLHLLQGGEDRHPSRLRAARAVGGGEHIALADQPALGLHRQAEEDVAQLADIARPLEPAERLQRTVRHPRLGPVVLAGEPAEEVAGERLDVLGPLAQRRHPQGEAGEPLEQVVAKLVGGDERGHVAVGGGDHAHVELFRAGVAEPGDLPVFQEAEQLGLEGEGHVRHLVEEERAARGQLELARFVRGLVKGAPARAEQLALEQGLRDGGAVERDVGPLAAGKGVQGRSDQLLAAACLAADEHRHTDGRDGADVLVELDHLVAADDGLVPGGQPALERLALAVQPPPAALVVAQDRTVQGEQLQRGQVVGGEPVAAAAVQVDTAEHPAAAGERRAHERAAAGRTVLAHAPAAVHHLLDQVLADLVALLARVEAPRQGVDQFVLVVDQGEEAALRPQEVHGRVEQPLLEGGLLVQGVQVPAQVAEPAKRLRHLARRRLGRLRSLGRLFRGEQDRGRVGRGMRLVPVGKDRRGPLVGLVVDKGEGVLDDAEGRAVAQAQGIDLAPVHPHGIGAAVVEKQVIAVLLPADGGVVAGDLGRGEDDVVVRFAADGHRGGEGHHPVLLAILADDQSGHGVAVCW